VRVHLCIKTIHAVLRHNPMIPQASSKLRFKAVYGFLRPVLCAGIGESPSQTLGHP
jgi:hypothetical protein